MNPQQIETQNPANGQILRSYPTDNERVLQEKLARAQRMAREWRTSSWEKRTRVLRRAAEILHREKSTLAALMHEEMGKSRDEGLAELEKCASCAIFYAEHGPAFLAPIEVPTEGSRSYVSFQPLGTVLAVMPWNFPFWQVFRCAVPATLAGNTVLLKHASNVTGCALAIERIWIEASEKEGLLQTLLLPGDQTLPLLARPEISALSFTGSTEVGKRLAATAGGHLKKCVLELGGSDAYVVLEDADIPATARICARSRLINGGQSCIAAKRFLVAESVHEIFVEAFARELRAIPLPPLAREDLRADLHEQVQRSIALGARLLCGGEIPAGPGWFYPATLLTGVRPGMPAFDEELFGPVAAVTAVAHEAEAIALANRSAFGLGAAVFTQDKTRGLRIAERELEAGSCFVNDLVRSDPRLPFGGIKDSGFGRELSDFGIREFVNVKTVYAR